MARRRRHQPNQSFPSFLVRQLVIAAILLIAIVAILRIFYGQLGQFGR